MTEKHTHTDECWEPDSGCDMGRNEKYVAAAPLSENLEVLRTAVAAIKQILYQGGSSVALPADSWIERAARAVLAMRRDDEIERLTRRDFYRVGNNIIDGADPVPPLMAEIERLARERDELLRGVNEDEGYEALKRENERLIAMIDADREQQLCEQKERDAALVDNERLTREIASAGSIARVNERQCEEIKRLRAALEEIAIMDSPYCPPIPWAALGQRVQKIARAALSGDKP